MSFMRHDFASTLPAIRYNLINTQSPGQNMLNKFTLLSFFIVTIFALNACATVKLTHGGEKARLLSSGEVTNCQKRGATTVRVKPTLLTIARQPTVIAKELQILARNSSVNMGGDTVTPISKIDNGEQTFAVYRCVP